VSDGASLARASAPPPGAAAAAPGAAIGQALASLLR
jgi:hypothetical protein